MFKNIFKKKEKKENLQENKCMMVAALLVHAAKIDDNYTNSEREIIKKSLIELNLTSSENAEKVLVNAEEKEKESNQIIEFTKEIKKNSIEFRLNIIEILWKIVYSDGTNDKYEANLIRRICGLLYVSDKDSGMIKLKINRLINKI